MKTFNKIFIRGLVTLLPIMLTIYLLTWSILLMENLFGSFIRTILPGDFYIPGLGVVLTVIVIFVFGLLLNNYLTQRVLENLQERLTQIPFIKVIYAPLRDLMNLFSKNDNREMGRVVLVKVGQSGMKVLGIVTRESFKDLPPQMSQEPSVSVYMPLSYALGGFTCLVPKSQIEEIDLPIEKAMSLAITGWVKADPSASKH